jgi:hypothetical protein
MRSADSLSRVQYTQHDNMRPCNTVSIIDDNILMTRSSGDYDASQVEFRRDGGRLSLSVRRQVVRISAIVRVLDAVLVAMGDRLYGRHVDGTAVASVAATDPAVDVNTNGSFKN